MSRVSEPPRAVYAAAVETLAGSVVRALSCPDDAFRLAEQLPPGNTIAGLAAVRVLGPDVLAPYTLAGHQFTADDADVVATSIATFPESEPDPDSHDGLLPVRRLRDWATSRVLLRLGAHDFVPAYPTQASSDSGREPSWVEWTGVLAQLSPLAFPGLDSPVRADARRRRLDTARGVTRAVLRRDYLTAARLTRWLAASGPDPMVASFPPEPVLSHLELLGGGDTRLELEIIMARRGLERAGW